MKKRNIYVKQQGASVIELMIAMVVGLMVMVTMVNMYVNNKGSFHFQDSQTKLQNQGNFLLYYFNKVVRNAGYRTPPPTNERIIFTPTDIAFPVGSNYISALANTGANNSDSLTVIYQGSGDGAGTPDGLIRDCLDTGIDSFSSATNTFSVDNALSFNCRSQNGTFGTDSTLSIINQVELMKIQLGEDTNGDQIADRYVAPNYVGLNPQNVRAIRVGFLLRSNAKVLNDYDTNIYNVLGTNFNPPDDKRLRRVFTTTIQLRNVNPSE